MRQSIQLAALALLGGCIHLPPPLVPANSEQAVEGDPLSAAGETGSVRITVHPAGWGAYPDLDAYVTPVELLVENGGASPIVIRHDLFTLTLPNGFTYDALAPADLRRYVGPRYDYGAWGPRHYGAYGVYPWPGIYAPRRHYYYPYTWWGDPWFGGYVPLAPPPPPPALPPASATPTGALAPGGRVSMLLFFPVPANQLGSFVFDAIVLGADGRTIGAVQLPFERRAVQAYGVGPPGERMPTPGPLPSPPPQAEAPQPPPATVPAPPPAASAPAPEPPPAPASPAPPP